MSTILSFSNNKKDVQSISDPIKRAYIPRLIKSFNPVLSSHYESLKNSSSKLTSFDPSTPKKESYLLFNTSRFHYFEQDKSQISFGKHIYDDCFSVLSKHIHFRFVEVASQKIVSKIEALKKSQATKMQESSETFKVLGDTGVLMELNYKIAYVQLDLDAKKRNWNNIIGEQDKQVQKSQFKINFVGIFFGILAVYLPPIPQDKVEQIEEDLKVPKKEIQYIGLKRELMRFIGVKKSNSYYLVFHKFHLLHRNKYREYSEKYLTQAAVKQGFFGSIGDFFKGAAGTIANGVTKAVQTASNVVDFYNNNIKPAVEILTPIVSPYLPDNIKSLLPGSKENAQIKKDYQQEAQKLAATTNSSVKQCIQYLQGLDKLTNFQMELDDDKYGKDLGVNLPKIRAFVKKFIGKIVLKRSLIDGGSQIYSYPALIYNQTTIITSKIIVQEDDEVTLQIYNEKNSTSSFQINVPQKGTYNYFTIDQDQKIKQMFDSDQDMSFKLDFRQNYSSDECFYEALINKNIILAEFGQQEKQKKKYTLNLQASKIIKCYRQVYYHLFKKKEKSLGGVVFYIDENQKNCNIISFYQNNKEEDFGSILTGNSNLSFGNPDDNKVAEILKKCSSKFLSYNTYVGAIKSQTKSDKEANLAFDNQKVRDENAEGQPLRTQLKRMKIAKSSPLQLIGIISMESQTQNKCGIGYLVDGNIIKNTVDKDSLYLLTLKQNILLEGIGFVAVRKAHQSQEEQTLSFNFNEKEKYQYFQVDHFLPYEGSDDYIFVSLGKKPASTTRKINTLSINKARNTHLFGGFYVEFDLSQAYQTRIINVYSRDLLDSEQSTYNMNVNSKFPQKQGIFFAYDKSEQNKQSFLGFYSSKSSNKIVSPPEQQVQNSKEAIIFITDKNGQYIQLSKMRPPNSLFGTTYSAFEAVGSLEYIENDNEYNGSGSFISWDQRKKSHYILTAAHNFFDVNLDFRDKIDQMKFYTTKYRSILFFLTYRHQFSLKGCKLHINPQYVKITEQIKKNQKGSISRKDSLRQAEYDIALIQLAQQISISRPLFINISKDVSDYKISLFDKVQDICVAGYPGEITQPGIKTKIEPGQIYFEIVGDHLSSLQSQVYKKMIRIELSDKTKSDSQILAYYLSANSGQSGGPIFNLKTFKLIGVNITGDEQSNYGCYIYNTNVHQFIRQTLDRIVIVEK